MWDPWCEARYVVPCGTGFSNICRASCWTRHQREKHLEPAGGKVPQTSPFPHETPLSWSHEKGWRRKQISGGPDLPRLRFADRGPETACGPSQWKVFFLSRSKDIHKAFAMVDMVDWCSTIYWGWSFGWAVMTIFFKTNHYDVIEFLRLSPYIWEMSKLDDNDTSYNIYIYILYIYCVKITQYDIHI